MTDMPEPRVMPTPPPIALPVPELPPRPYGFWATAGWGAIALLILIVVQTICCIPFVAVYVARHGTRELEQFAEQLQYNGLLVATATLATALVGVPFLYLIIRLRRLSFRTYLGLTHVRWRPMLWWVVGGILIAAVWDGLAPLLGRPIIPPFMVRTYESAVVPGLMFVAFIAAAPILEECFFRGFLFRGLAHRRLGGLDAVVITSAVWAALHIQYEAFVIGSIFLMGLYLGFCRLKTGSIVPALLIHALWNLIAMIEVAVYVTFIR